MKLEIYNTKGKPFTIEIDACDLTLTVENVKQVIENQYKIPINKQILLYKARIMDNTCKIINYNFSENTDLMLVIHSIKKSCCSIA